jgi:hypothetical protein
MSTATASKVLELSDWDGIRAKVTKMTPSQGRARIGNHLYAYQDNHNILIKLHDSEIVRIFDDNTAEFNFCGWPTKTTIAAIESILARATVTVPSEYTPLWERPVISFGGNPWLGFQNRPRRSKEPVSIDINVREPDSVGYHGKTVFTLLDEDLDMWWHVTTFVPNWKDYVK